MDVLSDPNKAIMEDVILKMSGEPFFALLLGDDNWAIFIAQEFLDYFEASDNVIVSDEVLNQCWGKGLIGADGTDTELSFVDELGVDLEGFFFRYHANPNMGTVANELKSALRFIRYGKITTYTSTEVLEMSAEDDE